MLLGAYLIKARKIDDFITYVFRYVSISYNEQRLRSKNITTKIFSNEIYDLDASKATGHGRIPAIVLKMCSPELSPVLAKLYNKCFS